MRESFRCSRLKLVDERTGKLLTFKQARALSARTTATPAPSPAA